MNKLRKRRLLYLVFFLIFFIIGPILALYTAGYFYNFKKNRLEKTGILVVDSRPAKAAVYLDGLYQNLTPSRITRLLPQKYNLLIAKDNYYPWLKEIEIKSNLTTFYKDIILFKKNLPILKISGLINIFEIPKEKNVAIYSVIKNGLEELKIFNLSTELDNVIATFSKKNYSQLSFVESSLRDEKVLLKQQIGNFNKYLVVDIANQKINDLTNLTKLNFEQIHWDNQSSNILYGLRNNALYKLDLYNNIAQPVLTANMLDFQIQGNLITYVSKENDNMYINQQKLTEREAQRIKLPSYSDYSLVRSPADVIVLLDKKNNNLVILKSSVFSAKNIEDQIILQANAKDIAWSDNNQKIAYYNDLEIWTYDFAANQNQLAGRYSTLIAGVFWHPDGNYIFYQTENKIKTTEANVSEQKNSLTLAQAENIAKINSDANGNIYFTGQIGKNQGIYQLIIN